ncbi:NAD(P)H-flavin reductase [Gayadomonas joobiniege]|uniref:NAD(P)H-flavin reductase n=1 Tax=Gayadomonas joobiniege TaxID=1234606 RepID=UPI00037C063D|nr:NAD(P)H-flavin reductase [Gayadomonas joobiniege]
MSQFECSVSSIEPLTEFVNKVILKPATQIQFQAGQYIEVVLSENDKRPFSIANSPLQNDYIELHIGAAQKDEFSSAAMQHIKDNDKVLLKGPNGNAFLQKQEHCPIILLAGGTGFSYVKSIAETLLAQNFSQPVFLYWGLRSEDAVYELEHWYQAEQQHANFKFIPVIENAQATWSGRTGLVIDAVLNDFTSLHDYHIYSAGPFAMVGKARKQFVERGLQKANMFADAFAFIDD